MDVEIDLTEQINDLLGEVNKIRDEREVLMKDRIATLEGHLAASVPRAAVEAMLLPIDDLLDESNCTCIAEDGCYVCHSEIAIKKFRTPAAPAQEPRRVVMTTDEEMELVNRPAQEPDKHCPGAGCGVCTEDGYLCNSCEAAGLSAGDPMEADDAKI